jgi:subtilisin family serine protease
MQKRLRQLSMVVVILLFLAAIGTTPSLAGSSHLGHGIQAERPHDPYSVLVKLAPDSDSALAKRPGARHLFDNWYQIPVLAQQSATEAMYQLAERGDVVTVELNYLITLDEMEMGKLTAIPPTSLAAYPNDEYYSLQWHLPLVQSDAAWNINRGANVTVAVVDSGVSRGSDLQCRTFVNPYNAITDTQGEAAVADDNSHGTHVAGTIGQCTNNTTGVAGMAPNVTIMPVKVLNAAGTGSMAQIAAGIDWAANHNADVINLSLGMDCNGQTWPACSVDVVNDAIDNAVSKDAVIIVATGNSNQGTVGFPANHPQTVAVGAVDVNEKITPYSNHGLAMTLAAPGGDITKNLNGDQFPDGVLQQTIKNGTWDYYFFQGTSMASPHVAGAAALLRSYVPAATRTQVADALIHTAKDLGTADFDELYGHGLIQTAAALTYLHNHQTQQSKIHLPLMMRSHAAQPAPQGIYGRVTYNDGPGAGIKLTLRKYNDSKEVTVATTYADNSGRYRFENIPTLESGYRYYVRFGPNTDNDHFVAIWYGPDITSYQAGSAVSGGDFDIANTLQISPDNRSTHTLPVTFTWHKRPHQTDTYKFELFDNSTKKSWASANLGYINSFTLDTLPSDVNLNQAYGWDAIIFEGTGGSSYGYTYYYRLITFQASGVMQTGAIIPRAQMQKLENKAR